MKNILLFILLLISSQLYSQQYRWYALPNAPYDGTRFDDVYFINENTGWIIRSTSDPVTLYKTTNGGVSWDSIINAPFEYGRSIGFANAQTGWIGSYIGDNVMLKTTNGGTNWTPQITGTPSDSIAVCGMTVLNANQVRGCGAWYGGPKFFKTNNGGANWTIKNMNGLATRLIDCYFTSPDSGYLVGGLGPFSTGRGVVLFTSDGGENWVNRFTTTNIGQWGWKISFPDPMNGYVSLEKGGGNSNSYFLKTTNGGVNWTENLFLNLPMDEEGIGFINAQTGWIGGWWFSTYRTTNGGQSWHQDPWGYNFNRMRKINDTLAYAVGQTVYKYMRDSLTGITQISSEIPERPELSQNFPNPFNPATTIRFRVVDFEPAKLSVYDPLGREIAVLVDEMLKPGYYEYKFDGTGLESGIYFYKVNTMHYSETKKMVLVK